MGDFLSKAALDALVAQSLQEKPPSISASAPEKPKNVSPWAQLATVLGHAVDAGTTVHAMNTPGVVETNPLLGDSPSATKVALLKGSQAALQMLAQMALGKRHPKLASALGYGTGALGIGLGIHNERQISKAKKSR